MTNGAPSTAPPPLVRPRQGRIVAGVALGIADRLAIEVIWVRLAFVFFSLFGGAGVLVYLVAWLLIPEEGESESIVAAGVGDLQGLSGWLGVALIVFGGLIIFSWTGIVRPSVMWAGALIVVGVLLYRGELPQIGSTKTPSAPDDAVYGRESTAAPSTDETSELEATTSVATAAVVADPRTEPLEPAPPSAPVPAQPSRPKSVLGRITIAVGLIALGAMTLLDTANIIHPTFRHYLAVAVGVVGLGLLVGTLWGRSWGLIVLGLVLMPVLIMATIVQVPLNGEVGDRTYRPETVAAVPDVYELAAGSLKIDLRDIDLSDGPIQITASVGFGEVIVTVPPEAATTFRAEAGFGEVVIDGASDGGINVTRAAEWPGVGLIEVDLEVGFGSARLVRAER